METTDLKVFENHAFNTYPRHYDSFLCLASTLRTFPHNARDSMPKLMVLECSIPNINVFERPESKSLFILQDFSSKQIHHLRNGILLIYTLYIRWNILLSNAVVVFGLFFQNQSQKSVVCRLCYFVFIPTFFTSFLNLRRNWLN